MAEPDRLTEQAYWDRAHREVERSRMSRYAQIALGSKRFDYLYQGGYVFHVLYERTLGPHLEPGDRVLEIGSAPGLLLAKLARRFGIDPWGIDYSADGVRANRETFTRFGFDPAHVIHGDFFSDALIEQHRTSFDVVSSYGFVEHFRDVRDVIARHVALLKPGGILVIAIPNLRGINAALTRFFKPELLDAHNLDIMARAPFEALFDGFGLTPLYCGYVGLFNVGLQAADPGTFKDYLLRAGNLLQIPLELAQRRVFGTRTPEVPWSSPYLHYIGRLAE